MRYVTLPLNYAHLSTLLSLCGRERNYQLGSSIHAAIIKNSNHFSFNSHRSSPRDIMVVWNALLSMYAKCGQLFDAMKVFDRMQMKDPVSWNSMISGCLMKDELEMGFECFKQMYGYEICRFDRATLTTILSACAEPELLSASAMMHAVIILNGYEQEIPVGNALLTAYFKCGCPTSAHKVFDGMQERNIVTWTAMVSGLAQSQLCKESLILFKEMRHAVEANSLTYSSSLLACCGLRALKEGQQVHGLVIKSGLHLDLCVESALMDMYSKCGIMEDALLIFMSQEEPDEVSLTVILVGFAQNGMEERAFKLFAEMVGAGIEIDANMISAVLGAFGASAPFCLGKQIHSMVVKKSLGSNVFVSNGLVNMYSKCGELMDSVKIFNQMVHQNSVSWNSVIGAFARHGHGLEALQLYEDMKLEGMEPTDVTFLSLLHACSHVGSIEKGMGFLRSMSVDHGITPRMEHYACMVDMLGRAGLLNDARRFIEELPVEPSPLLWQPLLGACSIHGNLEMGKYAAQRLLLVEPECSAAYVLLANILSSEGRWEERGRIIKEMKERGVKKDTGMSWIEVEKGVHIFVVEDRVHPEAEIIYKVLDELVGLIRDQEHLPDKRLVFYDLEL
ncbi:pentatricopeptide repeat-containing protein At3g05340 [Phoenix dactylifera]|uniref:Pentatricopeptide repeat-containing protein At3g05340 n=1 Tax=Phoenix dactylifera TaxID=42345 RepID=A0A8B7MU02_PHODC|nr:pentatricopeptide repeat-containing protein At3g05340 [Phoenix dactylifera]